MSDHEWCRDVRRDEAIRAAEDAAAVPAIQHRDLPEIVADLRKRVAKIEEAMMSGSTWYPICDTPAPPPPPAPPQPAPVPPAEGLRTERVTLEITHRKHTAHEWAWPQMIWLDEIRGESVRVVEDAAEITLLTTERDAAIRERDEAREQNALLWQAIGLATTAVPSSVITADDPIGMMRRVAARVAEVESAAKAAPAANAGGESNPGDVSGDGKSNCQGTLDGSQEPVAWGVLMPNQDVRTVCLFRNTEEKAKENFPPSQGWTHFPLYSAPQPPRGWLTAEMRDDLDEALEWLNCQTNVFAKRAAAAIATTLARSTPTRVPPPPRGWLTAEERGALKRAFDLLCDDDGDQPLAGTVQQLLARETPPRVKVPRLLPTPDGHDTYRSGWNACREEIIAAIREAGWDVEG